MTLGIMQPYFLPYIGYWQLMAAVDRFVIYDNVKYTKQGWINRNRFLRDGHDAVFTVPLKKGSDHLAIGQREVADSFDRDKLLRALAESYRKAPQFASVFPLVERIVQAKVVNLFAYIQHSLEQVAASLDLQTPMIVSSTVAIDHSLTSEDKVIALCSALGADRYLNPINGRALYSKAAFAARGIRLEFLEPGIREYPQLGGPFVPSLSIVDVLMFNPLPTVREMLREAHVVPAV